MKLTAKRNHHRQPAPKPIPVRAAPPRAQPLRKSGCSCGGGCPACKAQEVAGPDHPAEREADAVAARVMLMATPDTAAPVQRMEKPTPMRQPEEEKEEVLQRQPEEEEILQARTEPGGPVAPNGNPMAGLGSGQPLTASARAFFEPRFGRNFAHVRVHDGTTAQDRARSVNARAFAYGSNIVFNQNRYSPGTQAGRHLLAHELTHVVQQGKAVPKIQRQVQIDQFVTSATPTAGLDPDMTTAFFNALGPGGLHLNAGVTRFSINSIRYANANTIAQNLSLPLLSERNLRAIPQPNLRDPKLARVWNDKALVKKGQEATAVRLIQQALLAWGRGKIVPKDPLPIFADDAIFGDETLTAVWTFQSEWTGANAPLQVDGLVGPLTLGALEAAMADLNVSEFWCNTAPNNHITGTIHHILPPASWSAIPVMRSTLLASILAAGFPTHPFTPCRRRDNRLTFSAQGPANLDQLVLTHEQIHEADIGTAVRNQILPWYGAVTQLVANGQRFRAVNLAAAEALIYAEIARHTAPAGGTPCSVGRALEVELVNLEFALHRLPRSGTQFTGFTTNAPRCDKANANINHGGGGLPRQVPVLVCNPSLHMNISVRVPV